MLSVRGLTRRYGDTTVVDHVSFDIPTGMMTGFVGANGAGKTTTMRMIMGVLAAHAGEVALDGGPLTRELRATFGYIPEERGLYPDQPVLDQLGYLGELHGMSRRAALSASAELLERFDLGDKAKAKLDSLSLGNQQRVQIAAALLHSPRALILDEPFSGLDPDAVDSMVDLLRERCSGIPILFSSHQLDLVDRLCDHLVVLQAGRVVAEGDADELREAGQARHRLVTLPDAGWVRSLPGVTVLDVDGPSALVELADESTAGALAAEAVRRGELHEFTRVLPSLSEIFREVTR
ncbi:MAG: ATP-binding cassette domain-containing protein [Arthrobacter sp.]|jgi:ABC-2 type transport system ATP-binding protein|nr:ATP-binding cassette domain-containing protein [Arthrobacter sp.]